MKKIGLLLLALIFALGTLGVGYAMWSDTIFVKGTVNTGTVDITVDEYSATYVYKILSTHGIEVSDVEIDNADYMPVASAVAEVGENAQEVVMTYDNLFPGELYCADFGGAYLGTIPAHIYAEISTDDAWLQALWDAGFVTVNYTIWDAQENVIEGDVVQLHEGYRYNVALCIEIPQEVDDIGNTKELLSGMSGSFEAKIVVYQWNETYTP